MIITEKSRNVIGFRLANLRKQKGLKQKEVAAALGICQKTYSAKEQGRAELSNTEIIGICRFYEIASPTLLGI